MPMFQAAGFLTLWELPMNDGEALRCRDELMAAVDTILAKEVRISAIRALAYEPLYRNVYWVANKSFEISKFKFNISESSNFRTF